MKNGVPMDPALTRLRRPTVRFATPALLALATISIVPFDFAIGLQFGEWELPGDVERSIRLAEFFAHGSGFLVVLMLLWKLAPELRLSLPRLCAAYFLAGTTANLLKLLIWRLRPNAMTDSSWFSTTSFLGTIFHPPAKETLLNLDYMTQSFPSGHSASVVALAIALGLIIPRGKGLFLMLAALACLQRACFMAHWPSDVFAGAALGSLSVVLVYYRSALVERTESSFLANHFPGRDPAVNLPQFRRNAGCFRDS
jgi:membrane-associated phospholipid phosphatase